jgi:NADPH-dependent glutamate synthase beta subunit-like oxidoreductase
VTVFEGSTKGGGMLRYGIPSYRLPDEVLDAEIQAITDLGVELRTGVQVGRDVTMEDLRRDYQAVYLGIGAQKGVNLGLKGEDAPNVFSGVDFLRRVRLGEKIDVGDRSSSSAAEHRDRRRSHSRRLGAHVTLVYWRTRKEMPAIEHEITEAEHEGVVYEFSAPLEVVVKGRAVALKSGAWSLAARRQRAPPPVPVADRSTRSPARQ